MGRNLLQARRVEQLELCAQGGKCFFIHSLRIGKKKLIHALSPRHLSQPSRISLQPPWNPLCHQRPLLLPCLPLKNSSQPLHLPISLLAQNLLLKKLRNFETSTASTRRQSERSWERWKSSMGRRGRAPGRRRRRR